MIIERAIGMKLKKRPRIWQVVLVGLSLSAFSSQAWTRESQPRLVTDEFQESLERISALKSADIKFPPDKVRFVRLVIHKTNDKSPAGIDELEIFAPAGKDNLALAQRGAVASASSVIAGYAIHKVEHLNDGKYGNDHSWIAATNKPEWVQIELPQSTSIGSVVITRDRTGKYTDRIPEVFEVLISQDGNQWQSVVSREKAEQVRQLPYLPIERLPEKSWDGFLQYAFLRERATWSNIPADDHLSPLVVNRPAQPGGAPYWNRIASLAPLERVLVLFEEMIERLDDQGLDVAVERRQAKDLRRLANGDMDSTKLYLAARRAKRQLFFRDPALALLDRILFAKRHPFHESHNYSEHFDGILEPGGGIYVLNIPRDEQGRFRPERALIQQLFDGSEGVAREPVSDFDAKTIYFAYRPDKPEVEGWDSYWHLYSMGADGSNLRKLTKGPFHDFDAVCLPDGGLAFNSTRCKVRFLCWRPQAYVLHRMDADGSNITRLSHANLTEWRPSVMQSGLILWTRSEYLDKGADYLHTLWSIRPDGTGPQLVFGNNTPNCYSQAHEVPGTKELVCTLMSHGDHHGPIALIDGSKDPFDVEAITNITPDTRPQYEMDRSYDDTFRDPYPISRDHFLVTHNPDNQHSWGLYVIDRYGNREWLYVDPEISSKYPSPLRARPRPPALPSNLDEKIAQEGMGQFTVQDVYLGLGSTVPRGQAKYLRVAEEVPSHLQLLSSGQYRADHSYIEVYATPVYSVYGPPKSFETRTPNAPLDMIRSFYNWPDLVSEVAPGLYRVQEGKKCWPSYVAKASLGTVKIAEDGSVNFLAPAGKVLYFQLLDSQYNELQRMRSVIQLQPGERRSCVGCHENRRTTPPPHAGSALVKEPQRLTPPPWGTQAFDYQKIVQPVLNANCVRCHDGSESGRCDLRGTLDKNLVPASYRTLITGGWVHYFNFGYSMRPFKAEPLSFGTLKSHLWEVLADKHHKEVKLNEAEMRAIKAWVDLNCPLWSDYISYPERKKLQAANCSAN